MPSIQRTGPTMLATDGNTMTLSGAVGFDTLVDQTIRKRTTRGFDLNIVLMGETAIGKSTLLDSLFNSTFEEAEHNHTRETVETFSRTYEIQEEGTTLRLNVAEVLGFGDQVDRSKGSIVPVKDYVLDQFNAYLEKEMEKERDMYNYDDTRPHVCLYFISPTGHSLKSIDVVALKELGQVMNVIPIIAKADTMSKGDLAAFKKQVMEDIKQNDIQIYNLPVWDQTIADRNEELQASLPLSVVGSREVQNGKRVRVYPWGKVEVENSAHSDFNSLRDVLLRLNTLDLINKTHDVHYSNFRRQKMTSIGYLESKDGEEASLQATYDAKHAEFMEQRQRREQDMRTTLTKRIKDKEADLRQAGLLLKQKFDQHKADLEAEKDKLRQQEAELRKQIDDLKLAASQPKKAGKKTSFLG